MELVYDDAMELSKTNAVYYRYTSGGETIIFGSEEVLHFKSHYTADGITGISVREQLRSTLVGNIEAQEFINKTIKSGMTAKSAELHRKS